MAKVNQRKWKIPGQRTKRKAWGFTTVINGKQKRCYKSEWTQDDAEKALAALLLNVEQPKSQVPGLTMAQAAERYLAVKARKRSLREDRRLLEHLMKAFGAETPLAEITASRISQYKAERLNGQSPRTKRPLTAAGVNRPLALLRHLLRVAHEEWEVLSVVPKVRLEREPQGRIRWLEPDEEVRLLDVCRASRTKHLAQMVTVALETGLRKAELMGLTWDRVDLSRGVIRLDLTKSGKRRDVPMRQAVYDVLAGLPAPRQGRVWPTGDIRKAFESAVEAAKLDDFHFHDTRHHFASWFVMRGGRVEALQKILGHATLAMTMRYAHLAPDYLRSEVARTERPASLMTPQQLPTTENLAQEIAQETASAESLSVK